MAKVLIDKLKKRGTPFVIAPYEADAQIADLYNRKVIDFAISEDSDLLVFGCEKVLFKLDKSGHGQFIDLSKMQLNRKPNLQGFTMEMFQNMCILAGCDYLKPLRGLGIMKASTIVHKYRYLERILRGIRFEANYSIPDDYEYNYKKAQLTFRHQLVYKYKDSNPRFDYLLNLDKTAVRELLQPQDHDLYFLGPKIPPNLTETLVLGDLNPSTYSLFNTPLPNSTSNKTQQVITANFENSESIEDTKRFISTPTIGSKNKKEISGQFSLLQKYNQSFQSSGNISLSPYFKYLPKSEPMSTSNPKQIKKKSLVNSPQTKPTRAISFFSSDSSKENDSKITFNKTIHQLNSPQTHLQKPSTKKNRISKSPPTFLYNTNKQNCDIDKNKQHDNNNNSNIINISKIPSKKKYNQRLKLTPKVAMNNSSINNIFSSFSYGSLPVSLQSSPLSLKHKILYNN